MRVAVYGCSFTYGARSTDFVGWPTEFAKLHPQWEIYDFSASGTSLEFSALMCERYHQQYDLNIFQVTLPNRVTEFDPRLDWQQLQKKLNGVYKTPETVQDRYITMHDVHHNSAVIREYVAKRSYGAYRLEHKALIEMAKTWSDLVFGVWHYNEDEQYYDIPYLCDEWDTDLIESIKSDTYCTEPDSRGRPGHFNHKGRQLIAEWVDKRLKTR